ncbi:hypothetical protein C0J52_25623 [Blattella germanica]|nr:hypothetical protein C0J52_25623 [Blattella germanica]
MFSPEHRVELILLYGYNHRTEREEFHHRHSYIPKPFYQNVAKLLNKFKTTFSVLNLKRKGRPKLLPTNRIQ